MLTEYFAKRNIRLTNKGRNWCDNIETWGVLLIFLVPYPLVGLVEGSKWFG